MARWIVTGGCVSALVACAAPHTPEGTNGFDGSYAADRPTAPACTADYAPGGRNPGRVTIANGNTISLYDDREGQHPIAEGCAYAARGTRPDPKWFGTAPGQSATSTWTLLELAGGSAACEARFHFVAIRAPEGEGRLRHMHLRYGARTTSLDALVAMSTGAMSASNPCDPWWSVYCLPGVTGCDPE